MLPTACSRLPAATVGEAASCTNTRHAERVTPLKASSPRHVIASRRPLPMAPGRACHTARHESSQVITTSTSSSYQYCRCLMATNIVTTPRRHHYYRGLPPRIPLHHHQNGGDAPMSTAAHNITLADRIRARSVSAQQSVYHGNTFQYVATPELNNEYHQPTVRTDVTLASLSPPATSSPDSHARHILILSPLRRLRLPATYYIYYRYVAATLRLDTIRCRRPLYDTPRYATSHTPRSLRYHYHTDCIDTFRFHHSQTHSHAKIREYVAATASPLPPH